MISSLTPTTSFSYLQEAVKAEKPCDCGVCPGCVSKTSSASHEKLAISVSISDAGRTLADRNNSESTHTPQKEHKSDHSETDSTISGHPDEQNSEEETAQIEELKSRDREVRAHEMAHLMAAGDLALGGPSFDFQTGPDGKQYAVGGEVQIDTSPVEGAPEATIRKAARIQAAANAPAEPSSQDRSVAAQAASMALSAQAELAEQKREKDDEDQISTNEDLTSDQSYGMKPASGTVIDLMA